MKISLIKEMPLLYISLLVSLLGIFLLFGLRPRGILEMVRTGKVAMVRGSVGETKPAEREAPAA